jgi:hypothetical protein
LPLATDDDDDSRLMLPSPCIERTKEEPTVRKEQEDLYKHLRSSFIIRSCCKHSEMNIFLTFTFSLRCVQRHENFSMQPFTAL